MLSVVRVQTLKKIWNISQCEEYGMLRTSKMPCRLTKIKGYCYKLEDIDLNGNSTMHGPANATPRLIYGIGK